MKTETDILNMTVILHVLNVVKHVLLLNRVYDIVIYVQNRSCKNSVETFC